MAGIGPVSMVIGSLPATAKEWNRARGVSPSDDGLGLAHDQDARGAVGDLRRVAGGDPAVLGAEGRLQVGQRLDRGVGADALVGGDQLVGVVALVVLDGDRDDLPLEAALGRGLGGPLVRADRELVEVLAAEVPLLGDELGALALADQAAALGVAGHGAGTEGEAELADDRGAHRGAGHDLDPAADDHVVGAGDDALGPEVEGLLARAALAVDGGGRHRLGEPGGQDGAAADVERLLADLHDAAHDHVVDQGGVEVVALDEGLQGLGAEVGGVPVAELAVALAPGGANGVDDDGVSHGVSPSEVRRRVPAGRARSVACGGAGAPPGVHGGRRARDYRDGRCGHGGHRARRGVAVPSRGYGRRP